MVRVAVNGISLNLEREGSGPALLLIHGFGLDHSSWKPILPNLPGYSKIGVDLIGHGLSDAPKERSRYRMARLLNDLKSLLEREGISRCAAVVGYSLGGRVALHLALEQPERVGALIVESASPGIGEPAAKSLRLRQERAWAKLLREEGIEAFVDLWEEQPLFLSQRALEPEKFLQQRKTRLANSAEGLANCLLELGTGSQEDLLGRLPSFQRPALFLAGEKDPVYAGFGSLMASKMARGRCKILPGCGHNTHLESPLEWSKAVLDFLGAL